MIDRSFHFGAFPRQCSGQISCPERITHWVKSYQAPLLSLAYHVLGDWALAEDCVQEAFIQAGLRIHQLRSRDREFAWLSKIVLNQSRTILRREKQQMRTEARAVKQQTLVHLDVYPSVEHAHLHSCVARLPRNLQLVVILHYYHDWSVPQIAEALRTRQSTVRVWLHRARRQLQHMLGKRGNA
ncbi:sigma-70 family RNA polymerase sigma factor [Alicyclobacillus mali (ex Roth et al. 2021)]|uniref:RNA polymerase sigma factor n=1 Tax=Alicyclobacillus mali (ex Roth et al. 2021) TaxID=1123961 RepID=UPI001A8E42F2